MQIQDAISRRARTGASETSAKQTRGTISHRQPKDAALISALSMVVHDLRGPLANLLVLIELIETYARMQAFDRLDTNASKARALIANLDAMLQGFLERARDTGDPLAYRPALVDLADVVATAARQNAPIAGSRGIALTTGTVRPYIVSGDRRLLVEAVDNLINNAVKHAPVGSSVQCAVTGGKRDVVIEVTDEGQGIGDGDLARLFLPFSTLSSDAGDKDASRGLGLWIVRLIAERHGGHVSAVRHHGGRGATFAIHLPISLR
ncbi:MAG: sensor histidine kinase [Hyphomicrobiaceae bacterium]